MIERKLWNGWNKKKMIRLFLIVFLLMNGYMWYIEAEIFGDALYKASGEMFYAKLDGIQLYHPDLIQGTAYMPGFICTVFFMAFLAVVIVHRESFFEHWDVTLRRIPKFRGKYLFCKTITVLFPGVVYLLYYFICWQLRWARYVEKIKDDYHVFDKEDFLQIYRVLGKEEFMQIIPKEPLPETALYLTLVAMALLLLSLTVRRVKKDILGFVVAIAGLLTMVVLFSEALAVERTVEIIVLSVCVGIIFVFNIRHVYWKW